MSARARTDKPKPKPKSKSTARSRAKPAVKPAKASAAAKAKARVKAKPAPSTSHRDRAQAIKRAADARVPRAERGAPTPCLQCRAEIPSGWQIVIARGRLHPACVLAWTLAEHIDNADTVDWMEQLYANSGLDEVTMRQLNAALSP